jgi:hypothetical protein
MNTEGNDYKYLDWRIRIAKSARDFLTVLTEGILLSPESFSQVFVDLTLTRRERYLICEMLCRLGARINVERGFSPLMTAVMIGDIHIVRLLLKYGADPNYILNAHENLITKNGDTALSIALNPVIGVNDEIVMELINSQKMDLQLMLSACFGYLNYEI